MKYYYQDRGAALNRNEMINQGNNLGDWSEMTVTGAIAALKVEGHDACHVNLHDAARRVLRSAAADGSRSAARALKKEDAE